MTTFKFRQTGFDRNYSHLQLIEQNEAKHETSTSNSFYINQLKVRVGSVKTKFCGFVSYHYHYHYHCHCHCHRQCHRHRHRCYYQSHDQNNKYCIEMECVIRICNCERKIPSLTSEVWTNFHSLSNDRQIWSLHLFFSLRRTSLKVTISIFFVSSNNILIYAKLANNYIKSLVSGSSLKQLVLP